MEYLITAITIFIEDLALLNLSNAFLKRTCSNRKLLYSFILLVSLQVIMVHFFIPDITIFKTLFIIICYYAYIKYTYDGKVGNTLFTVILCYIFNIVCDYLAIIGMTSIVNISLEQIYQSVSAYVILTFIAKFLFFVGTFLFEKMWSQKNKKSDISALEWGQMLIFPIISVVILIMMIYTNVRDGNDSFWNILITLGLFTANIITLFIISRLSEDKKIKQDNIILQQQVRMSMDNVKTLMTAYSSQRKLTHDFNNHIETINGLISKNEINAALQYLKNLNLTGSTLPTVIKSNNPVIDAILNYKYSEAQDKGIVIDFNINDLSNLYIADEDIVIILGNALDNAIEASSKCLNKRIKIKIFTNEFETVISIQNTVNQTICISDDNSIQTTKSNDHEHGYGIKNIKSILYKYDHIFTLNCENNWFQIAILINK